MFAVSPILMLSPAALLAGALGIVFVLGLLLKLRTVDSELRILEDELDRSQSGELRQVWEREWLAVLPVDGSLPSSADLARLEASIRDRHESTWASVLAIGLFPFLFGFAAALYDRDGGLAPVNVVPTIVGLALTLLPAFRVWWQRQRHRTLARQAIALLRAQQGMEVNARQSAQARADQTELDRLHAIIREQEAKLLEMKRKPEPSAPPPKPPPKPISIDVEDLPTLPPAPAPVVVVAEPPRMPVGERGGFIEPP